MGLRHVTGTQTLGRKIPEAAPGIMVPRQRCGPAIVEKTAFAEEQCELLVEGVAIHETEHPKGTSEDRVLEATA